MCLSVALGYPQEPRRALATASLHPHHLRMGVAMWAPLGLSLPSRLFRGTVLRPTATVGWCGEAAEWLGRRQLQRRPTASRDSSHRQLWALSSLYSPAEIYPWTWAMPGGVTLGEAAVSTPGNLWRRWGVEGHLPAVPSTAGATNPPFKEEQGGASQGLLLITQCHGAHWALEGSVEAQCLKVSGARHATWHSGTQEMPGEDVFHLKVWPMLPEAEHRAAPSVDALPAPPQLPCFLSSYTELCPQRYSLIRHLVTWPSNHRDLECVPVLPSPLPWCARQVPGRQVHGSRGEQRLSWVCLPGGLWGCSMV